MSTRPTCQLFRRQLVCQIVCATTASNCQLQEHKRMLCAYTDLCRGRGEGTRVTFALHFLTNAQCGTGPSGSIRASHQLRFCSRLEVLRQRKGPEVRQLKQGVLPYQLTSLVKLGTQSAGLRHVHTQGLSAGHSHASMSTANPTPQPLPRPNRYPCGWPSPGWS